MKITEIAAHLHSGTFSDLIFVEVKTDDPDLVGWGNVPFRASPMPLPVQSGMRRA